jgi:hypothetical protein
MKLFNLLCVVVFVFCAQIVSAQDLAMVTTNASTSYSTKVTKARPEPVVAVKRAYKVSAAYEGYAIVVSTTALPLLSDDALFRQFGNLTYDQNADGTYSYLILTPFQKKKNVKRFYERVIKGKNPNATIVRYKAGKKK